MSLPKITVVGSGQFGTALAKVASFTGKYRVSMLTRSEDVEVCVNQIRRNPTIYTEFKLHPNIIATRDTDEALKDTTMIIGCLPAQITPKWLEENKDKIPLDVPFVNCAKGMIVEKEMFMSQWVEKLFDGKMKYCMLSGPSFAEEMMREFPTLVVVASKDQKVAEYVQTALSSKFFRCYTQEDVIGVEVAGALKNVIAIGAGLLEGFGFGYNTISGLISVGSAEIQKFATIYKANPRTFFGLAGIGDLMLTGFGKLSRNRTFGSRIAKGEKLDYILENSPTVEGLPTLNVVMKYIESHDINCPIIKVIYAVVHGKLNKEQAMEKLMLRPARAEEFDYGVSEIGKE
eukprot:CAMPEP_0114593650 /NCGR_PEP_ID=MMETSP0125-20121206/15244_1 /TAXON_ID=485358 ORGANISM="Aristerostoma sp., Strain ATCC 50986" /NCGR_SAMPLE_ID=MMETSP0125 /ASSEMBLY_ACC=CAM_ASM_000245 /LENGTH=344 /DNA_ID=CAMNT_0001793041 /DNA_START=51 /DNA_END=1085 /DNA_ORIENTATION=+